MPATATRAPARPTLALIRRWAPSVCVAGAAPGGGQGPRALYRAIASGRCPVKTITVGGRRHVLTWSLIAVLEGRDDGGQGADGEPPAPEDAA